MWLKPFSTNRHWYLYATQSNRIFRIDTELANFFDSSAPEDEKIEKARSLGLFSDEEPRIAIFDDDLIARGVDRVRSEGPEHLALSVTEACNFRCRYCAYSGAYTHSRKHNNRSMSPETAKKAVDWYFGFSRKAYHIGFYGGEPLLKFKLIRQVIEQARKALPDGATLSFGMTTNGWLLNDTITDFLVREAVELFISLDGAKEQHDLYRLTRKHQPTFETIWNNVERLRVRHSDYFAEYVNFSMTMVPPNTPERVQAFMQQHPEVFGGKVPKLGSLNDASSNLAQELGISSIQVDTHRVRAAYLNQLIRGETPDALGRAVSEAGFRKLHQREMGASPKLATSGGQCVPGMRCHVMSDGSLHMCEHGDEHWPIGDIYKGFDYERIAQILRSFHDQVQSRCENCWAVRHCRKCIPQLTEGSLFSSERLDALCRSSRYALERDLIEYCQSREKSPNAFDGLATSESI